MSLPWCSIKERIKVLSFGNFFFWCYPFVGGVLKTLWWQNSVNGMMEQYIFKAWSPLDVFILLFNVRDMKRHSSFLEYLQEWNEKTMKWENGWIYPPRRVKNKSPCKSFVNFTSLLSLRNGCCGDMRFDFFFKIYFVFMDLSITLDLPHLFFFFCFTGSFSCWSYQHSHGWNSGIQPFLFWWNGKICTNLNIAFAEKMQMLCNYIMDDIRSPLTKGACKNFMSYGNLAKISAWYLSWFLRYASSKWIDRQGQWSVIGRNTLQVIMSRRVGFLCV